MKNLNNYIIEKLHLNKDIMKTLKEYLINEQIEPIDEGLKDWLKKAALTAAIATACINLSAAPQEKTTDIPKPDKEKIEYVQQNNINDTKKLTSKIVQNDDGSFTLYSIPSHLESTAIELSQSLENAIMKDYKNMKIKDVKKLYNPQTKVHCYSYTLIGN